MAHIRLQKVNKVYENGFHAVYDFDMEIEKGEFIVLVGPSGCGKSTTLRMIAGLEDISDGELYIGGELANQKSPRDRGVAMVFQSYALYPNMTVFENLAFGLTLKGINQEIIEKRVLRIAKILGLTPYLERMPRELSGGQRQRVAVGRAIIRRVEVFLMDEPLSNLDAKQRVTMRSEITQIHRKVGATTIYVTHDQTEAMTMADRIVVMKNGYVQQIGTPKELYFNPVNKFVTGFIGEPPMNFIDCKNDNGTLTFSDISVKAPASAKNEKIILGFRPEAAKLSECEGTAFKGTVELVEMLGDYCNMYIDLDGIKLIIKVSPYEVRKAGEDVTFYVPREALYFFDGETEEVLKD
ncbi:MAG: sn-glycerol-3-phosphate ABC transporter ATP-binding protein UgpC [Oscillospiraceae bacterium]|nr:sn-glycerol-3-phosphate ABC transporter ATP-binding protein UgpC [Oscillospiraceae bacterium]